MLIGAQGGCLLLVAAGMPAVAQQSFQYTYDGAGQLQRVVDSSGTQIEYVYDAVGNITEIRRTTVAPGLQLFGFSPQRGGVGTLVTVQGRGFALNASGNVLAFNGIAADVESVNDSGTSLTARVPGDATSGPITLIVDGHRASSSDDFLVLDAPAIASLSPSYVFPGEMVDLRVTGYHLASASFAFEPQALVPRPSQVVLAQDDTGVTLQVTVPASAAVGYVVIATGPGGDSGLFSDERNTLRVLSGNSDDDFDDLTNAEERALGTSPLTPDTDADGFSDSLEAGLGANPTNPASVPIIEPIREALALPIAVVNVASPAASSDAVREALSAGVAVVNEAAPDGQPIQEAMSLGVAVVNEAVPVGSQAIREVMSASVSVGNASP